MQSAPMRPVMAQSVVVQPPMTGYRPPPMQMQQMQQMQQPQPYFTVPQLSPHPHPHPQQPVVYAPSVPPPQQRFPAPVHYQQPQPQSYAAAVVANPTHQIIYVQHQPVPTSQTMGMMQNGSSMQQHHPITSITYGNQLSSSAPSYHPYHQHQQHQHQPAVSYVMSTAPISSYGQQPMSSYAQQPMVSSYYQTQQPPAMYTTMPSSQPVVVTARPPVLMTQQQYRGPPPIMPQQTFVAPPDPHQNQQLPNMGKPPQTLHSKVLEIVNPKTNEVINKQDVDRSRHSSGGDPRAAVPANKIGDRRRLMTETRQRPFKDQRPLEPFKHIKRRIDPLPFEIACSDSTKRGTFRRTSESSDGSRKARSTPEDVQDVQTTTVGTTDASDQEERSASVAESASSLSNSSEEKLDCDDTAPSSQSVSLTTDCTIGDQSQEQMSEEETRGGDVPAVSDWSMAVEMVDRDNAADTTIGSIKFLDSPERTSPQKDKVQKTTQPESPPKQQVDDLRSEAAEEQTKEQAEVVDAAPSQQPPNDSVEENSSSPVVEAAAGSEKATEPKSETETEPVCSSSMLISQASLEEGEYRSDDADGSASEESPAKSKPKPENLAGKVAEMKKNNSLVDIKNRRYSSGFLLLVGRMVAERDNPKCPVAITQLAEYGIDQKADERPRTFPHRTPQQLKLVVQRRSLGPTWHASASTPLFPVEHKKQRYQGRQSDRLRPSSNVVSPTTNNKKEVERAPAPIKAIERTTEGGTLHQAPAPWKPMRRAAAGTDSADLEEQMIYKNVRSMLNKITPSTFETLCDDFLRLELQSKLQNMDTVISIIFDKAVEEPTYTALYIKLFEKQIDQESKSNGSKSVFRNGILNKCQTTFETAQKNRDELLATKRAEANAETDEKKRAELLSECEDKERKERRRVFGLVGFIGHLYCSHLLTPCIVQWCIMYLLKQHMSTTGGDEECVECVIRMLTTIGKDLDNDAKGNKALRRNVDCYYESLRSFNNLSTRVRFSIDDLIELQANKWVARKSVAVMPTTIKEVRQQAEAEERQNEIDREQHFLQTRGGHNRNGGHLRGAANLGRGGSPQRGRPGQHVNRPLRGEAIPSTPDRRMHAAAAASSVPQTVPSKNLSLLNEVQKDSRALGHSKKKTWASGACGGGGSNGQQDTDRAPSSTAHRSQTSSRNG